MVTLLHCSNDHESRPVFLILLLSGLALFVCPTVFSLLAM